MSDPIREQVSAFLDGELPDSEVELLLRRLTRDPELRQCFGRYALIGEAMRGQGVPTLSAGFAARVERAIDGHPAAGESPAARGRAGVGWKPFLSVAAAAGVAAVAVMALQHRAVGPAGGAQSLVAKSTPAPVTRPAAASGRAAAAPAALLASAGKPREALSYTVPAAPTETAPVAMPAARFTSYVFAHSQYSSVLGQSNVLSGLLTPDEPDAAAQVGVAAPGVAADGGRAAAGLPVPDAAGSRTTP